MFGKHRHKFQTYQCRGGSRISSQGGALKKIAPSRGRRENFWGISCEKSRFYAKISYFFNFRGGARNFWSISCEKSRFYAKKNHIFTNFRGERAGCAPPPPLNPPLQCIIYCFASKEKLINFESGNFKPFP